MDNNVGNRSIDMILKLKNNKQKSTNKNKLKYKPWNNKTQKERLNQDYRKMNEQQQFFFF